MNRELVLKIMLTLAGLLFLATAYPMVIFIRQEPALSMMFSLYVTLGVFLLLALRNPSANRSLIAFTAWSSLAHAALMGTQAWLNMVARGELIGVAILAVIGVAFIALAPRKAPMAPASRQSSYPRSTDSRTKLICGSENTNPPRESGPLALPIVCYPKRPPESLRCPGSDIRSLRLPFFLENM